MTNIANNVNKDYENRNNRLQHITIGELPKLCVKFRPDS